MALTEAQVAILYFLINGEGSALSIYRKYISNIRVE